jgi:ADP-ribose pyrophosphatase YjhB (NUDIX family)
MPAMPMAISNIVTVRNAAAVWIKGSSRATSRSVWYARACSFIFYQDPKVVAGTVFTLNGGIVLLKRGVEPAIGKWVFSRRLCRSGESVQDAAVRETKEECLLDVKLGPLLNVYSYPRSPNVIVVYTAEVISGTLTAADESTEAAVFASKEIPWHELAFDSTKDALSDYIRAYLK